MVGEWWIEGRGTASVRANGLYAHAEHVALLRQKVGARLHETRSMWAILPGIDIFPGVRSLRPPGAQQQPRTGGNTAVLLFPLPHPLHRQQKVRIFCHVRRYINHASWSDKFLRRNFVHAAFRQVLAADPMNRRIKVRARMLAGLKTVPVPRRATIVVT